jgi:hypothetical protein
LGAAEHPEPPEVLSEAEVAEAEAEVAEAEAELKALQRHALGIVERESR